MAKQIDRNRTNERGLTAAISSLERRFEVEMANNPRHFGRITLEIFTTDGVVTGCETHVRETSKNQPVEV